MLPFTRKARKCHLPVTFSANTFSRTSPTTMIYRSMVRLRDDFMQRCCHARHAMFIVMRGDACERWDRCHTCRSAQRAVAVTRPTLARRPHSRRRPSSPIDAAPDDAPAIVRYDQRREAVITAKPADGGRFSVQPPGGAFSLVASHRPTHMMMSAAQGLLAACQRR